MKNNILIGLMTLVWLVLMANIMWQGMDGKWQVDDVEKIGGLEVASYTDQIIVVAISEDSAKLCFYERKDSTETPNSFDDESMIDAKSYDDREDKGKNKGNRWKLVLETDAVIGKNGLPKRKEGDGKTPVGTYYFTKAFGRLENPGTNLEYIQVDERHYWIDDNSSTYYNQFISIDEVTVDWESAEHIVEYGECYDYVLATSYNMERIPGKGSAVFLHCTSGKEEGTAGCIAVPKVYMKEIIQRVEKTCVLIVDYEENILKY